MTDFLASLQQMLSGAMPSSPANMGAQAAPAGGMNYGAAPTAQGIGAQVLARLRPQGTIGAGPLGQTPPLGGNNLAAAVSGLSAVDPTASKFGAFAQGLAGGLAARRTAQVQDQTLGIERNKAALESLKQAMAIQQQKRQMAGVDAASEVLGGGAPASGGMPAATAGQGGGASVVTPTSLSGGAGPSAPPAPPDGGSAPSAAPPMGGAPPSGGPPASLAPVPVGPTIPIENTPNAILARAARLSAAADASMSKGNSDVARDLNAKAASEQARATAMLNSGKTTDRYGNVVPLPGWLGTEAAAAGTKKAAEVDAENAGKPTMNPDGSSYVGGTPAASPSAPAAPTIGNTPTKLQLDPQTASVTTSIPSAPAGGGYPLPNVPPGGKLIGVGENAKETAKADAQFDDLVGKAPLVDSGIERYKSAAQALKLFQSGPGAEQLNAGAALAQSLGFPDIAQKIQGGDPAALQWLNKEGVGLTLDTLKAAQPRFAQAEFNKVAERGVPNPDALPQANHQLITEGLGTMLRSQAFIKDWQVANKQGWTSPSAFYSSWSAANPLDGFTRSAQKQIGTFRGMDLPAPSDWTQGATYAAPKNMTPAQAAALGKRGVQPGQLFRFNGAKASTPIEPIAPGQGYSSQLQ